MGTPAVRGRAAPLRVVVIDDEELIGRVAARVLADHDVVTFVDPVAALAHLVDGPTPDLVLCDLSMPGLTGVELYERAIAAAPRLARRFVFLSGGAASAHARETIAATGVSHFDKPFTAAELRGLVAARTASSAHELD